MKKTFVSLTCAFLALLPSIVGSVEFSSSPTIQACTGTTQTIHLKKDGDKLFYPNLIMKNETHANRLRFVSAEKSRVTVWENGSGIHDKEHCSKFVRLSNVVPPNVGYVGIIGNSSSNTTSTTNACRILSTTAIDPTKPLLRMTLQAFFKTEVITKQPRETSPSDYFYYPYTIKNGFGTLASVPTHISNETRRVWGELEAGPVDCFDVYAE